MFFTGQYNSSLWSTTPLVVMCPYMILGSEERGVTARHTLCVVAPVPACPALRVVAAAYLQAGGVEAGSIQGVRLSGRVEQEHGVARAQHQPACAQHIVYMTFAADSVHCAA